MSTKTTVKLGRQRYVVTHDEQGVLYVTYDNAVMGQRPLMLDRPLARKVLAEFNKQRNWPARRACEPL